MDIIYYHPSFNPETWLNGMKRRLPMANVRLWQPGDDAPADYALARQPPVEMLQGRTDLKALFALGAGVDDILEQLKQHPSMLTPQIPLFRLEDTGMAVQMQEYALYHVLSWFRRFPEYQQQKQQHYWHHLKNRRRSEFAIGIMGAGVLGKSVAACLRPFGFPLRCWSRSAKQIDGVTSYHGGEQLAEFLSASQVLINLLPNTPQTAGIINRTLMRQLPRGAFILNLARGAHLVETDLLAALDDGEIAGAALDVFASEPLSSDHPFWAHPAVAITPHNAAVTLPDEAMDYIAAAILKLEAGEAPAGKVDRNLGY
ncbi:bifunctional glyoxylate/hydroxypyruvate reductase A [Izhakiella australiensis]|uniref:Bifunctional glyoxylate/hydroxypyruvate reductase A n=1 Tax=Izhakiella australiensis TaxID=1926881 RepID=A0A1S8YQP1_9GAMM|nr:glyoxylate/hydroxypyruvate reductase GhrA [Izhakiella australiensis]OON41400.1 bifunctional glyoxylate/hydroxypyruvate reductase A [Izhakiella australiensis]